MKKYDNIIFDVGDVLLEYRWKQMLMDCGLSEEEAIRVGHELFDDNDDLWHIFDLAIMSDEEILNAYCKKVSGRYRDYHIFYASRRIYARGEI